MNALAPRRTVVAAGVVASLPMYDLPELHAANDALWSAIAERLRAAGLYRAPATLARGEQGEASWIEPDLLLTQTCGYPLALGLRGQTRVVATPGYRARGCHGAFHRSVFLVRTGDAAMNLADMRGATLALNAPDSNTGMNLLRVEVAPLAQGAPFFAGVVNTGSHARSVAAVAEGVADLAAVDCVTWAHLERFAPALSGRLRVLGWSAASLGLPLVTGASTSDEEFGLLVRVLEDVALDPALQAVRRTLLLDRIYRVLDVEYRGLAGLRDIAAEQGYPHLV